MGMLKVEFIFHFRFPFAVWTPDNSSTLCYTAKLSYPSLQPCVYPVRLEPEHVFATMTKSKCLSIIKDFLADVSEISEKNELLETTQLAIWLTGGRHLTLLYQRLLGQRTSQLGVLGGQENAA